MPHRATLLLASFETHDVKRFVFDRPHGFDYAPGYACELALDRDGMREDAHPFTLTSLPEDGALEFTIKAYPDRDGLTERLHRLEPGATVLLSDPFATYRYAGPGVFLAGGAGVTPFLAVLRDLERRGQLDGHRLIVSNRTPADVICEKELRHLLGDRLVLVSTRGGGPGLDEQRIDAAYLEAKIDSFDQHFYVCGPPAFTRDLRGILQELGADKERIVTG